MSKGFYNDGKLYYRKPIYWTLKSLNSKNESEIRGGDYIIYDIINKTDLINGKFYNFIIVGEDLVKILL